MSNALRMPFAEWLGHMAACGLAPPGRIIAVYAAVFNITSNGELASMTGVEGRSLDKWKQRLVANGWVIIPPCRGGRGNGIEVIPAYRSTPISFTDIKPKKGSKYYPRNFEQTPAEIAEDSDAETPAKTDRTPAEITPVLETPAKITGVISDVRRARVDNNIYNTNLQIDNNILASSEQETACAREGETEIAPGLFKNCTTFRHRNFVIDVPAVEMQVFGKAIPKDRIVSFVEAQARQWAAEIANGGLPSIVVPRAIARALAIGLTKEANFEEAHQHGMAMKTKSSKPKLSRW